MSFSTAIKYTSALLPCLALSLLSGCGGEYVPPDVEEDEQTLNTPSPSSLPDGLGINLSMASSPSVDWQPIDGTTQLAVQFIVRDGKDQPMNPEEYSVQIKVNDRPLDVESLVNQSAEDQAVNLYLGMVLDASYSMTQHTPPAFDAMKAAARDSYQELIDLWSTRPGQVKFSIIWFDSLLHESQYEQGVMPAWQPDDILTLPTPQQGGGYTKLIAAVDSMTTHMQEEYDSGVFNGPRDQYVMLVFSDGKDNYSWFDNSSYGEQLLTTSSGASYLQFGVTPSTLTDTQQNISQHPSLTTHVIGLGSDIDQVELQQLADAGNGTFLSNPSSSYTDELFRLALKEFTTIQTQTANVPLAPGEYTISVEVTNIATQETDQTNFRIRAGDENAALLPE